jgi:hypothetical protein
VANPRRIPYTKPIPEGAELFTRRGKRFARSKDIRGKIHVAQLTEDGTRLTLLSPKCYGEYREADDAEQRVPLSTNATVAGQMLAEWVRKVEWGKVNLTALYEEGSRRPVVEHLDDGEASIPANGATAKHVKQTVAGARRVPDGWRLVMLANLAAESVRQFLAKLRERRRVTPELEPAKQSTRRPGWRSCWA